MTPSSSLDPQERAIWRAEIRAALAAGRDLPPEMEGDLTEATLARATEELRGRGLLRPARGVSPSLSAVLHLGRRLALLGTLVLLVGLVVLAVLLLALAPTWSSLLLHWGSEGGR